MGHCKLGSCNGKCGCLLKEGRACGPQCPCTSTHGSSCQHPYDASTVAMDSIDVGMEDDEQAHEASADGDPESESDIEDDEPDGAVEAEDLVALQHETIEEGCHDAEEDDSDDDDV